VAVCTLVRHPHRKESKSPSLKRAASKPLAVAAKRVAASNLQEVEDRLLEQAIEHHPQAEIALDGAIDDMAALSAELQQSRRRPLLLRSTTNLNRIEDLLLEAVIRTHPNRERALDRLMDDVVCDGGESEPPVPDEQAAFDMSFDNDFDGLG
jgi:hypothetical protein